MGEKDKKIKMMTWENSIEMENYIRDFLIKKEDIVTIFYAKDKFYLFYYR